MPRSARDDHRAWGTRAENPRPPEGGRYERKAETNPERERVLVRGVSGWGRSGSGGSGGGAGARGA